MKLMFRIVQTVFSIAYTRYMRIMPALEKQLRIEAWERAIMERVRVRSAFSKIGRRM